jgi:PilZ domain
MGSETEKRSEDRRRCDAAIDWAYFNKGEFYTAHLQNVSRSGGYFECKQRIIPGATLFIRLHHCQACVEDPAIRDCMRSTALGEVKWCRELPDQQPLPYGVGIRYHMPV